MSGVIISNGFGQFHLRGLAEELDRRDGLSLFMSGVLPSRSVLGRAPSVLADRGPVRRLRERGLSVPAEKTRQMVSAEVLHQIAQAFRRQGRLRAADALESRSFDVYSRGAQQMIRSAQVGAATYHVRAGIGGCSILDAKSAGMSVLCDHSIAAPAVIDRYVPQAPPTRLFPRMWSRIQRDIEAADALIVNSDFVAQTFQEAGYDAERVHVAYTPVDPNFADLVDQFERPRAIRPVITFAGTAEYRKGIDVVVRVIQLIGTDTVDWRIIGDWSADALSWRNRLPEGVRVEAKLPREHLARALAESDVFFFPSRAEGSARVVAEALRAGCQLVTTRMSGSAGRDGIDGFIHDDIEDIESIAGSINQLVSRSADERSESMLLTKGYAQQRLSVDRYADDVSAAYARAVGGV